MAMDYEQLTREELIAKVKELTANNQRVAEIILRNDRVDAVKWASDLLLSEKDCEMLVTEDSSMRQKNEELNAKIDELEASLEESKKSCKIFSGMLVFGQDVVFPKGEETTDEEALAAIEAAVKKANANE